MNGCGRMSVVPRVDMIRMERKITRLCDILDSMEGYQYE